MSKTDIINNFTRTFHKVGFTIKKHSPAILVTAGVVGTVASGVMACKATTKLSGILEETKKDIDTVHDYIETSGFSDEYTEEDSKKDLAIIYTQSAVKLVKLYAPSVILGALSITAIVTSHNILRKRNIALAAAYATVDRGFKEYRSRIVERFGKELDNEIRYNIKAKEIEETVVDEKTGKEKQVKKTISVADPNEYSVYARFFDDGCLGWDKDPEYNLMYVKQRQAEANERLKAKGHLFLNEVYAMFGIPETKAGQVVGWLYDEKNPIGDNFVDFGIYDINREKARDFVNGYERTILLDFNVDGNIWEKM